MSSGSGSGRRAALLLVLFQAAALAAPPEPSALHWDELPAALNGRRIAVRLADGAVVEGKYAGLQPDSLALHISTTSAPAVYPKGPATLPRRQVMQLTLKRRTGWKGRTIGLIAGGGVAIAAAAAIHARSNNEVGGWSVNSASGAAVGGAGAVAVGYLAGWFADIARARPQRVVTVLAD
jgi:hypothetical protein